MSNNPKAAEVAVAHGDVIKEAKKLIEDLKSLVRKMETNRQKLSQPVS
jgi:hypothetical protein